jgi:hypothetical protein
MSNSMWVVTLTQEEWTYLDQISKNAAGVPSSLRFALDSATEAQQHMVVQRNWRDQICERNQPVQAPSCFCTPGDGCCPTEADIPTSADL